MIKRYAIRTIKAPAKYLDKDGLLVDSPQDARLYYRKGDCTNSLNVLFTRAAWRGPRLEGSKEDYEVIGMVVITASEWDLIEEKLAKLEYLQDRDNLLSAMEYAGVDNLEDGGETNRNLKEHFPETYAREYGDD